MAKFFEEELIRKRVYCAARDGLVRDINALIDRPDVELSEYFIEEDGEKCTPLIIAAKNGHNNIIKILLNKFKPNVEQEGTVRFDGGDSVYEGAMPLWCAAAAGHLDVVKCLVNYGANVNHLTRTNSTLLRAACFYGHLDIVKYLVNNGADIHTVNNFNSTCLMVASCNGHRDVVKYLLERADIRC